MTKILLKNFHNDQNNLETSRMTKNILKLSK